MSNQLVNRSSEQTQPAQKITFIENKQPALAAGIYDINVQQTTDGTGKGGSVKDTFSISRKVYVGAERFMLNPKDLYSMCPPKAYSGDVSNCLPNIVFSNPALPWMRTIGADAEDGPSATPWLALLMFYTDDPIPSIQDISLDDLGSSLPSDTFYPSPLILEPGESTNDRCQAIDVDVNLFNKVSPTVDDLQYLAHVRQVDVTAKAAKLDYDYHPQNGLTLKTVEPEQQFSVVICNRLPKGDTQCRMFLVSYENMAKYLPNEDGSSNITGKDKVRLVVLENWEFYATQSQKKMTDIVQNLNRTSRDQGGAAFSAPITLRLPKIKENKDPSSVETVNKAFSMGFVPLDHQTRLGGNTVSWQRSPFVPYETKETITVPQSCSDQLMRYNPENGLFDTTYAAAWQLGRLLCIQNKGFAYQLYQWKRDKSKAVVNQVEQEALSSSLIPEGGAASDEQPLSHNILESALLPMLDDFFNHGTRKSEAKQSPRQQRLESLESLFSNPEQRVEAVAKNVSEDENTQRIINWLARLRLLYGVPYRYLAPHKELLPTESIKFFHVDPNFTTSLIDGAFSIGRSVESDQEFDQASYEILKSHVNHETLQLRRRMFNMIGGPSSNSDVFTGFLLNSELVTGFPGLEVLALDPDQNSLNILRMEHLSSEILLCIFDGEIDSIQFTQPSEGLFFGLDGTSDQWYKTLRYPDASDPDDIGKKDPDATVNTIPYRDQTECILNINALAQSIKTALVKNQLMKKTDSFTSADFALQMTQGAEQVVIDKKQ